MLQLLQLLSMLLKLLSQQWLMLRLSCRVPQLLICLQLYPLLFISLPVCLDLHHVLDSHVGVRGMHQRHILHQVWRRVLACQLCLLGVFPHYCSLFPLRCLRAMPILPAGVLPQKQQLLSAMLIRSCPDWLPNLQLLSRLPILLKWILPQQRLVPCLFHNFAWMLPVCWYQCLHRLLEWLFSGWRESAVPTVPDYIAGVLVLC